MTKLSKKIVQVAVALGLGALALPVAAGQASAATVIGGVDIAQQCRVQFSSPLELRLLDPHNAYAWRCYSPSSGNFYSVDLNDACARQWAGGAFAIVLDTGNPYSWRCAR
ncbi:hypothetical protein BBK82_35600 [Lentzea guizhouensis]|uniref:Uncharacterized protein n=1 Tax=Lentzea guizhouensis TaxID=1586287 RepID=A0A1B2HS45_9PSEU|nr:hypothetical protein [Lentzea guizhouensis]ANZ40544.1 hypothetical protein BBK82_35600 [Lentzea guizhouensis]